LALKELGNAVRTTYLLEWIMDESWRRSVHKGTPKIERHHKFARHLAFSAGGHLRSSDPPDQEESIVYNELVTNAVAVQNVVDQTQELHMLSPKTSVSVPPTWPSLLRMPPASRSDLVISRRT
jgi:TnpA family transposase